MAYKAKVKRKKKLREFITVFHKQGRGYKKITQALNVPRDTDVTHIVHKFRVKGSVATLAGRGRTRKLSRTATKFLRRKVQKTSKWLRKTCSTTWKKGFAACVAKNVSELEAIAHEQLVETPQGMLTEADVWLCIMFAAEMFWKFCNFAHLNNVCWIILTTTVKWFEGRRNKCYIKMDHTASCHMHDICSLTDCRYGRKKPTVQHWNVTYMIFICQIGSNKLQIQTIFH